MLNTAPSSVIGREAISKNYNQVNQENVESRAGSGAESHIEDHPYQVSFKVDNTYYCGGFMVGEREVITPAHCTYGVSPKQVTLRAGSSFLDEGGVVIPVAEVVTHPEYNNPAFDKDVGYMITAEPIIFSETIQPIALPPRDRPLNGEILVSGWGTRKGEVTTIPSRVMKTMARVMDEMQCRVAYPTLMTRNKACSTNFFLSRGSTCQRDTEGTAIQDGMAVALVTFTGVCHELSPSVFADLAAPEIRDFFTEHLDLLSYFPAVMWFNVLCSVVFVSGFCASEIILSEKYQLFENNRVVTKVDDRIVGGEETSIEDHPYQASFIANNSFFCGAFIVSPDYVLTAGHCAQNVDPSQVVLRVGSSYRQNGTIIRITEIVPHPEYDNPPYDKDVAYMKTAEPIQFSETVQPIALPPLNRPVTGDIVVTGWGRTQQGSKLPNRLMKVQLPVVNYWQCLFAYPFILTRNMVCAGNFFLGGTGTCQGDSGGTAIQNGTAVAIVSFGKGCAAPFAPSVFAYIASPAIRNFISKNTGHIILSEKYPLLESNRILTKADDRIINGQEADIEDFPHQVSFVGKESFFCGGFIVSKNYILTAGHCAQDLKPSQVLLRAGSSFRQNGTIIPIAEVVQHPEYNDPQFDHDVAYMRTAKPIQFSNTIRPIALPPLDRTATGEIVVTGWGRTQQDINILPSRLMKVTLPIVNRMECLIAYPMGITRNMLCAGNFFFGEEGACQGDSGGSAIQDGMAVGIVSFGKGCGQPMAPNVFTNIAAPAIRNFISNHTGL
ncbi:transmembrane protease serine 9-like [Maniola jurtina]|uniref:transmembrane protease serine 9-like n=1 Tax=Maniola jurtina TaxID=191418 RepID=UPI001E68A816|nr:transmembrane protease serine 9-like [Maniola jurtina]